MSYHANFGTCQQSHQIHRSARYQLQRSAEASTQMVYQVYSNTVAMLEEFERRELYNCSSPHSEIPNLEKSNIFTPDQSYKTDQDIKTILQAQILLLDTQIKSCRPDVQHTVIEALKKTTIEWTACREIARLPHLDTDYFVAKIFDVIAEKSVSHPKEFHQLPGNVQNVSEEEMRLLIQTQPLIGQIDSLYAEGKQKARLPQTRRGNIKAGIARLTDFNKKRCKDIPDSLYDNEDSPINAMDDSKNKSFAVGSESQENSYIQLARNTFYKFTGKKN